MSTYNNDDSYNSTGRQGALSSADDSFANTTGGFGNRGRGDTTNTRGLTGSTFDDQESSAYGGSSTQESRGFNTGNSGGLRDNEFGSSNSKYGGDHGDDRNNFGTSSSDRSYGGNTDSYDTNKTRSGNTYGSDDQYSSGNTGSSGYDNTSSNNTGKSGDSTMGKMMEKAGNMLHKESLVQKGEAKRAAAGSDNY
ncbi:hypothetical protein EAF04_009436 [Stromatinia cepivora]|nr:hypothetical protein EAF04_009436 [Stromatinia cepivora]